jgi:long-subunit fatty acid transport protein
VLRRLTLASSFCLLPSAFGWAAHPFITDDAGTQGTGKWQLELMGQQGRNSRTADAGAGPVDQRIRQTLFTPVLTYGLQDALDVALGVNYLRTRVSENSVVVDNASGMSDSTLELKWRFYDKDGLSLAVKPGVTLPTGNENKGLGLGKSSWGVNLIADLEAEPWVWLANVSYFHASYKLPQDKADLRTDIWRVSGGAEYTVRKEFRLVGELGVRTNEARNDPFFPGQRAQYAMLGFIYSPAEKVDFDMGVRKGLNRAETDTVYLIGATFRW